jgi:putative spermidine/putrescine transport system permease protein
MMRRAIDNAWRAAVVALLALTLAFLIGPLIVAIMMSFDARGFLAPFPPTALSLRWYGAFFADESFVAGLKMSLALAVAATLISGAVGTAAALALTQYEFRGKAFLSGLFLSPLMIPAVVIGLALLIFVSRWGIFNGFSRLLCAHVIVTLPFTIRSSLAGLAGIRRSMVDAALSLGANDRQTFFDITFPLAKTGIIAGCVFAFAFSLDDVAVSLFLYDTNSVTLPIALVSHMRANFDLSVAAAATFLAFITVLLIVVLDRTVGLNRVIGQGVYR